MADLKILSDLSIAPIEVRQSGSATMTRTGLGQGMRGNFSNIRQGLDRLGRVGEAGANSLRFPLDNQKYYFNISISEFGGYNAVGGGPGSVTFNAFGSIVLPIPYPLNDTQEIEYSEYPFGPAWGTALNAANAQGGLNEAMDAARNMSADQMANAANNIVGGFANNLGGAAAGAFAGVAGLCAVVP